MSKIIDFGIIKDLKAKNKKNRKYIKGNLIRYKEEKFEGEFLELMKNGYLEMAKINLELSQEIKLPEISLHYKFDDINEYEKWLCGVWISKWLLWL